jgi:prepilin-type N-terminal cleavage/methylation domain-containing protein
MSSTQSICSVEIPDSPVKPDLCSSSGVPRSGLKGIGGFTLVELLTVVSVLAALVMIALPAGFNYIAKARTARCLGDLQIINDEIQSYYIDQNKYPATLADIKRDKFTDPWGEPYQYKPGAALLGAIDPDPLNDGTNDYDLWSKGIDRLTDYPGYGPECADDIVRASDGSFFGIRSDY